MSKCVVRVLPMFTKKPPGLVISTISKAKSGFSPFLLGPCDLYYGFISENMENGWQFSKVYSEHLKSNRKIRTEYWEWARTGWADKKAHRYPMGKGRKPEFSLWEGKRLGYIDARKRIYGPLYAEAVQQTTAWKQLKDDYKREKEITLLDYDAYDHRALGMSLTDVLNNPDKKMGHAFVLMMLLTGSKALNQMELRGC